MYDGSTKAKWAEADIIHYASKAAKAIKASQTVNISNVVKRIRQYRTDAPEAVIEQYLKNLEKNDPQKLYALGFPDPNAPKAKLVTRPSRGVVMNANRWSRS